MAVTLGVTGDLEGRTDLINNKYINFSLSLSRLSEGKNVNKYIFHAKQSYAPSQRNVVADIDN